MNPNAREFKMSAAASEWKPQFTAPPAPAQINPNPPQPGEFLLLYD
jgi:hypothetical protein